MSCFFYQLNNKNVGNNGKLIGIKTEFKLNFKDHSQPKPHISKNNFLALILKKSEKSSSYVFSNETLHFSPQAKKIKYSRRQKFLMFQEMETLKNLCFLKRKRFLYFGKWKPWKNFLYFSYFWKKINLFFQISLMRIYSIKISSIRIISVNFYINIIITLLH